MSVRAVCLAVGIAIVAIVVVQQAEAHMAAADVYPDHRPGKAAPITVAHDVAASGVVGVQTLDLGAGVRP